MVDLQLWRIIMSNTSSNDNAVSRLASQSDAVGRLAQDSGGFAAVVAAFESKDACCGVRRSVARHGRKHRFPICSIFTICSKRRCPRCFASVEHAFL